MNHLVLSEVRDFNFKQYNLYNYFNGIIFNNNSFIKYK